VALMVATCLPRSTIRDFSRGSTTPKPATLEALSHGLAFLDPENQDTITGWRERLLPETLASVLGVDAMTAAELYRGKRRWRVAVRSRLAEYLHKRPATQFVKSATPAC
jgi:hypothetical protein